MLQLDLEFKSERDEEADQPNLQSLPDYYDENENLFLDKPIEQSS